MAISFQHLAPNGKGVVVIAGRRIRVFDVLGYVREGSSAQQVPEDYNLPLAAVYEALAYAEEHPAEMAALRAREDEGYEDIMAQTSPEVRAQIELVKRVESANGPPAL